MEIVIECAGGSAKQAVGIVTGPKVGWRRRRRKGGREHVWAGLIDSG